MRNGLCALSLYNRSGWKYFNYMQTPELFLETNRPFVSGASGSSFHFPFKIKQIFDVESAQRKFQYVQGVLEPYTSDENAEIFRTLCITCAYRVQLLTNE